jgi:truncated hemoglobin YjbI
LKNYFVFKVIKAIQLFFPNNYRDDALNTVYFLNVIERSGKLKDYLKTVLSGIEVYPGSSIKISFIS